MKSIIASIAVLAIIGGIVALIVYKLIRDKRRGVSSCGCGCECCPMKGKCNQGDT